MSPKPGKIIVAHDVNVWPHEMETARALAAAGYTVEFIRRSEDRYAHSADVIMDGIEWEIKAPQAGNARAIQRCLHKGLHQAKCIIVDSFRISKMADARALKILTEESAKMRALKHLLFVDKKRNVIKIL